MTERPMLFQSEMVRAYRREVDPKTQTRRMSGLDKINAEPDAWTYAGCGSRSIPELHGFGKKDGTVELVRCPYGVAGDRMWTREAWCSAYQDGAFGTAFRADGAYLQGKRSHPKGPHFHVPQMAPHVRWKPSIHMPRWASRDTLEVLSAVPQRLQDITEADAKSEGVELTDELTGCAEDLNGSYVRAYSFLWDSINGGLIPVTGNPERRARIEKRNAKRFPWAKNPWVWKVEFRRLGAESRGMR